MVASRVLEFLALPTEPAVWQKEMRVRKQLRSLLRLPDAVGHLSSLWESGIPEGEKKNQCTVIK